jgi:hypothetical protein
VQDAKMLRFGRQSDCGTYDAPSILFWLIQFAVAIRCCVTVLQAKAKSARRQDPSFRDAEQLRDVRSDHDFFVFADCCHPLVCDCTVLDPRLRDV